MPRSRSPEGEVGRVVQAHGHRCLAPEGECRVLDGGAIKHILSSQGVVDEGQQ